MSSARYIRYHNRQRQRVALVLPSWLRNRLSSTLAELGRKDDAFLSNPSLEFIDAVLPKQCCDLLHDWTENYQRVTWEVGSGSDGDSEIVVKRV